MADLFTDEGLDALLAVIPKGGSAPSQMFVGLFTASGGTSLPAQNATLAGAGTNLQGCAEVSTTQWTTYARITVPSGSWGAQYASTVWSTTGRVVTLVTGASTVVFPSPSVAYNPSESIAGFFLSNASYANSGIAYYWSNFSDTSLIGNLAIGDVVKVAPTFGFGN